jgi:iron transport multicopper oxidase
MLETNLHPLANPGAPGKPEVGGADVAINLAITFDATSFTFSVNGAHFTFPTAPVLLQILSGARTAQDLLPLGSVYALPPNKVIEVSIPGGAAGAPVSCSMFYMRALLINLPVHSIRSTCTVYASPYNLMTSRTNPFTRSMLLMSSEVPEALSTTTLTRYAAPRFFMCTVLWLISSFLKVRRDVVSTGVSGDNVTFRFTTDNPGPWILHW